jgi:hypothetical protein
MSIQPSFDNPQSVEPSLPPIVLRFQGLHPNNLGRFYMHDHRKGGDLSHVDLEVSELNEVLHCEPNWQETIKAEIAAAKRNNFLEREKALRKKGRKAERDALIVEGESDPWRRCNGGGPLREGILTVNKQWLGGTGQAEWDAAKVEQFKQTAMDFLRKHFPDGQLRYANSHHDEEAFHIHFVIAVWTEKFTANRGRQVLLQASTNPLLKNYEYAQDLAGEAFAPLNIARGERRAEARRAAKAAGEDIPKKRRHIPPSEWRAAQQAIGHLNAKESIVEAEAKAKVMVDDGRVAGQIAIRKSRKRAIKEARRRNEAATRAVASAERQRQEEERSAEIARQERTAAETALISIAGKAGNMMQVAETAVVTLRQVKTETVVEVEKLQGVRAEVGDAEASLTRLQAEVADASTARDQVAVDLKAQGQALERLKASTEKELKARNEVSGQVQNLKVTRDGEVQALSKVKRERKNVSVELADLVGKVAKAAEELSIAEAMMRALGDGIDMLGAAVLRWMRAPNPSDDRLAWGANAPKTKEERAEILARIRPGFPKLGVLARAISSAVDSILLRERQVLAADAAYVLNLREAWEADQQAELTRIKAEHSEPDTSSDGPER